MAALTARPLDDLPMVAPWLWDVASVAVRNVERVLDVRYVIIAEDLQGLRRSLIQPEPGQPGETTRS